MNDFVHLRHKQPTELIQPRELIVACPAMRSGVNLSRIIRAAGCSGVERVIACGNPKIDPKITRDATECVVVDFRRTLPPVLKKLKEQGYQIVGLEQTTNSANMHKFQFVRRTVLVVGNERTGLDDDVLRILDYAVEIPVYGLPYSYNAATAAVMALYEFCRQFPGG